jgi:hypothetical protein
MQVAQRGDVTGKTATTYGGPDRWELGINGLGTHSISQSSTAPDGFSNSYKVDCTTADASPAAGDFLVATHKIEAQNLQHLQYGSSGAQKLTLSFYVRSNKTGTYVTELLADDPSRIICATYTISSADTWEFKKITFDGDTAGTGINDDNGVGLFVNFWLGAGSTYTSGTLATAWQAFDAADRVAGQTVNIADNTANEWMITGIQLEVGEQATPFEHRSFGDELARCQRYFCKSYNYDIAPGASGSVNNLKGAAAVSGGTSTANRPFWSAGQYPVIMRSEPTIVLYHYDGTSGKITGSAFATYDGSAVNIGDRGFNIHPTGNVSNSDDEDHYAIFTASAEL